MELSSDPSIRNLLHPTDFSHGSDIAFGHALKLAVAVQGHLEILHAERDRKRTDWDSYPHVRDTLCRWKLLPERASRADVAGLGIRIEKCELKGSAPVDGILARLENHLADVIVMATHRREGFDRWLHREISGRIAHRADSATLFVPHGVDGFVDLRTGTTTLQNILIPVDSSPQPQPAIDMAAALAFSVGDADTQFCLLHVGDPAGMPSSREHSHADWRWQWTSRAGDPVTEILAEAEQREVDLIAMTTRGRDGFLDALRGSTTERVLQRARCPILAVHEAEDS